MNNLVEIYKYDCYFFDFDGVVLESGQIKTEAFVGLYAQTNIAEKVRAYHLANQGVSRYVKFDWIAENLLGKALSEAEKQDLGAQFSKLVKAKVLQAPFVAGVHYFLEQLKAKGKHVVVASGTPQKELREIVMARNIAPYFNGVYGSPNKKTQIVDAVCTLEHFLPKNCLFLGDASTDYEAARNTGTDFFARITEESKSFWETVLNVQYKVNDFTVLSQDAL